MDLIEFCALLEIDLTSSQKRIARMITKWEKRIAELQRAIRKAISLLNEVDYTEEAFEARDLLVNALATQKPPASHDDEGS